MVKTIHSHPPTIGDYRLRPAHLRRIEGGNRADVSHEASAPGKPLVSIITVTFNSAQTLEQTIKSVLLQTYDPIEHIIIDGDSTDGTIDIIKKYDKQIAYWISEPDGGIGDAWNKGIAAADGEIIGILNADDWYEEDAGELAVETMRCSGSDIVYGRLQTWTGNEKSEDISADHALLDREMSMNHPAVFVTRAAYQRIGLYRTDFRYAMDYEWLLRAKKAGLTFTSVDRCLANMRLEGISNIDWRGPLKEEAQIKNLVNPGSGNMLFYYYKTMKGFCRRFLEKAGLGFLVRFFHANVSSVRKMKAKD